MFCLQKLITSKERLAVADATEQYIANEYFLGIFCLQILITSKDRLVLADATEQHITNEYF
jgi:hypothetical protein